MGYCAAVLRAGMGAQVVALPRVAAYLDSALRFPFPFGAVGAAYKANVGTVLYNR